MFVNANTHATMRMQMQKANACKYTAMHCKCVRRQRYNRQQAAVDSASVHIRAVKEFLCLRAHAHSHRQRFVFVRLRALTPSKSVAEAAAPQLQRDSSNTTAEPRSKLVQLLSDETDRTAKEVVVSTAAAHGSSGDATAAVTRQQHTAHWRHGDHGSSSVTAAAVTRQQQ